VASAVGVDEGDDPAVRVDLAEVRVAVDGERRGGVGRAGVLGGGLAFAPEAGELGAVDDLGVGGDAGHLGGEHALPEGGGGGCGGAAAAGAVTERATRGADEAVADAARNSAM